MVAEGGGVYWGDAGAGGAGGAGAAVALVPAGAAPSPPLPVAALVSPDAAVATSGAAWGSAGAGSGCGAVWALGTGRGRGRGAGAGGAGGGSSTGLHRRRNADLGQARQRHAQQAEQHQQVRDHHAHHDRDHRDPALPESPAWLRAIARWPVGLGRVACAKVSEFRRDLSGDVPHAAVHRTAPFCIEYALRAEHNQRHRQMPVGVEHRQRDRVDARQHAAARARRALGADFGADGVVVWPARRACPAGAWRRAWRIPVRSAAASGAATGRRRTAAPWPSSASA